MVRLELSTSRLETKFSSHWPKQLKSYCWEGVEFMQLVYCVIIYLSFLNCGWLLILVQLDPGTPGTSKEITVMMPMLFSLVARALGV